MMHGIETKLRGALCALVALALLMTGAALAESEEVPAEEVPAGEAIEISPEGDLDGIPGDPDGVPGEPAIPEGRLAGVKIGIDPGHQSKANTEKEAVAPGSSKTKYKVSWGTEGVRSHVPEYVVVLDIGLQLREALEAEGAEVYMTRETHDVNISNQERAIMMNNYGVDLVLRLHCDGSDTSSSTRGITMYVNETGPIAKDSGEAAAAILKRMVEATGGKDRGVRRSDTYTGLNWSEVPCILVEMGFMSNPEEDMLLNSPEYQQKLVEGMVEGICDWAIRE